MSNEILDPEFVNELLLMNEAAEINHKELSELFQRHPDLPTDVQWYLQLSAETISKMAGVMGRLGETLVSTTEALDRLTGSV